jgi:hypothetical protein
MAVGTKIIGRKMEGRKMRWRKMAAVVSARRRNNHGWERARPRALRIGTAKSKNRAIGFFRLFSFSFPFFG